MRITPQWHRESSSNQVVDTVPGNPALGQTFQDVTTHGFDFGGVDIWTAGTLYKDISFSLLPSSDSSGSFHFENVFVRFDNLLRTPWVNVKFGKFELDNLVSEKRIHLPRHSGFEPRTREQVVLSCRTGRSLLHKEARLQHGVCPRMGQRFPRNGNGSKYAAAYGCTGANLEWWVY
jgi:hypothetical protein